MINTDWPSLAKRLVAVFLFPALLFFLAPSRAGATLITLTHNNEQVKIATQAGDNPVPGVYSLTVDGVQQIYQQWYWYRIGPAGPESSFDTLTQSSIVNTSRTLLLEYTGAGFTTDVTYSATGGTLGSKKADLASQVAVTNTTASMMEFHLFEYSDFDLGGSPAGEFLTFPNANSYLQIDPSSGIQVSEVITPTASHREGNNFDTTHVSLVDGSPTTLNDNPPLATSFGPGDVTWAYEWDYFIQPGSTVIFGRDKLISFNPVPEPTSCLLVLSGIAGMLLTLSRRTRAGK